MSEIFTHLWPTLNRINYHFINVEDLNSCVKKAIYSVWSENFKFEQKL